MAQRVATTAIPYTELEVAGPYDSATKTGNFDESRATIDRIVIHTMDGTWEGAAARFDNPSSNVCAHYGIKLDGGLLHWLEEYWTAYHAGNYAMNQRSIGIEHEDGGDYNGVRPDVLYQTSSKLVADICKFYGIPCDRDHIKKHNEVSDAPTGCPDALDIDRIVAGAHAILNPSTPPPASPTTDQNAINTKKAVQFDQSLTALKNAGFVATDDSNQYLDNAAFVTVINNIIANWNSICVLLGIPAHSNKDAISTAITQLQKDKAQDEQTVSTQNQAIGQLTTRAEKAEGSLAIANQQLEAAQNALKDPTSGLLYKDLYDQVEGNLSEARKANAQAQITITQLRAQVNAQKPTGFVNKLKFLFS